MTTTLATKMKTGLIAAGVLAAVAGLAVFSAPTPAATAAVPAGDAVPVVAATDAADLHEWKETARPGRPDTRGTSIIP